MVPWVLIVAVGMIVYTIKQWYDKRKNSTNSSQKNILQVKSTDDGADGVEKSPKPRVSFYFGSQTGTAEGFAEELAENGDADKFDIRVVDLEDVQVEEDFPNDAMSVFLVATYGEGDPTDNAQDFFTWLEDKDSELPENCEDLKFAVFGLGDRQYEHYNSMGRTFQRRFEELGASCACPYGEGDNSEDLEEDFEKWSKTFWPSVAASLGITGSVQHTEDEGPSAPQLKLKLISVRTSDLDLDKTQSEIQSLINYARCRYGPNDKQHSFGAKPFYHAKTVPVVVNRELRKSNEHGSTCHIEIDISQESTLHYQTADNLSVCPRASDDLVTELAARLGYNLHDVFDLVPADDSKAPDVKTVFPVPCSVEQALSMYLNIVSVPKRNLLKHLAFFAKDDKDVEALMELAGDGHHAMRERWESIADVLLKYTSIDVPLEAFVQMVPTTKPREYTISSSSSAQPETIGITVSVEPNGLCSTFLHRADVYPDTDLKSSRVDVFVHQSSFRLPQNPQTPVIMIGPGTGIAPMRAFLQERRYQASVKKLKLGESVLYFGCKNRNNDDIYADELETYLEDGSLSRLEVAYSREQSHKIYVQHLIEQDADKLWPLINEQGGHVYVCGGTSMGNDVMHAFEAMVRKYESMSETQAKAYIKRLQSENRYVQELWS